MLDQEALFKDLNAEGLTAWASDLEPLLTERIADAAHGNLAEWRNALSSLPSVQRKSAVLNTAAVGAPDLTLSPEDLAATRNALMRLLPWRKGPFDIGGLVVDAEWRSNLKWDRVRLLFGAAQPRPEVRRGGWPQHRLRTSLVRQSSRLRPKRHR